VLTTLQRTLGLQSPTPDANANGDGHPTHAHAKTADDRRRTYLHRCIHLQLLSLGLPGATTHAEPALLEIAGGLLANYRQKSRILDDYRCPADRRIESYLKAHLADLNLSFTPRLPGQTFVLDQHGVARELSVPKDRDQYESPLVKSYRVRNGVLHNARSDRRTTKGTFHVAQGGLPIPDDKVAVSQAVFAEMFRQAVNPPKDLLVLPFTAQMGQPAEVFVSLLLRPLVCPAIPGVAPAKTMEILEFVKSSEVDPVYFDASYYMTPEEAGRRPYALLTKALEESEYVAIAKLTMHNREYTVFLRPHEGGLMLHTMYYEEEVRKVEGFGAPDVELKDAEVKVAHQLIEALAAEWEPEKFRDEFQENLRKLIETKLEGGEIAEVEKPKKLAPVVDLMAALKQSLAQMEGKKKPAATVATAEAASGRKRSRK